MMSAIKLWFERVFGINKDKLRLHPKNTQDFLILEILENKPELKLYRSDIFSGGVVFEYKGNRVRVTHGVGYCVEVNRYIVNDKLSEEFYNYLQNKYDCFTAKTPHQYAGLPLN